MLGNKALLVLTLAAYAEAMGGSMQPVSSQMHCPNPNGVFPIPSENCNQYMYCQDGRATVMECPHGLAFNPNKNWCDLAQNVQCNFNVVAAPATPSQYYPPTPASYPVVPTITQAPIQVSKVPPSPAILRPSSNTGPTYAPSPARTPTRSPAPAPASAPASAPALVSALGVPIDFNCQQSNGYYAISNECDTYILCQENVAYKASCPDGLHFNPEAKWPEYACDYSPKVQCASGAVEQIPKATNDCPRQFGFFPMPNSECSKYMRCNQGVLTVMDCPAGLVFNPDAKACDWLENVPLCKPDVFQGFTCPDAPLEADGTLSDAVIKYRYNNECSRFITCSKGFPKLLSCDTGKSFDEASQSCIDSAYVTNCQTYN